MDYRDLTLVTVGEYNYDEVDTESDSSNGDDLIGEGWVPYT